MSEALSDYVIGVVSDTHVPDHVKNLHPGLLPALEEARVQLIMHAGDISDEPVLQELNKVAPVIAVEGNRDFFFNGKKHPNVRAINIRGVNIGLMHGHEGFWRYVYEKFEMLFRGYRFSSYLQLMLKTFPSADIIVYGHTHIPENVRAEGKLIFNPGSAGIGRWNTSPTFGLLMVESREHFKAEIRQLSGAKRVKREWVLI